MRPKLHITTATTLVALFWLPNAGSQEIQIPEYIGSYADLQAATTSAGLPALHAALQDNKYARQWGIIADLIGFAGESEESSRLLIAFIEENDAWKLLPRTERWFFFMDKLDALNWLGFTRGTAAEKKLLELFDRAGAEALLDHWHANSEEPPWDGVREQVLSAIQGRAAKGLLMLQNSKYSDLVNRRLKEISEEAARLVDLANANVNDERLSSEASIFVSTEEDIYEGIIEKRFLDQHGLEAMKQLIWDPVRRKDLIWSEAFKDASRAQQP